MKRIKLFENFDLERLKSGIDDVFVELKDNGFGVRKVVSNDGLIIHITGIVDPNYNRSTFEFSEIEEYVLMLIDYVNIYLPKYKDDIRFIGSDSDFDRIIDTNSIDNVKTRLYWNQVENKEYKLRSFKVCFGDTRITKVIAESLSSSIMADMIRNDEELKRLWGNIEDIFVELKDDKYNVSITSYNSITGLDITLRSPRLMGVRYFSPIKYENIVDYISTLEDFMKDYYSNDEITFLYVYYDNNDRVNSTHKLSEELLKKYFISKIVITVQKNHEKIIQRQKDKYKYLTESNWNSDVYKIENDLSDMFVELFDEGYDVLIGHHQDTLTLSIRRDDKQKFNLADVREYFLMAEEYFRDINKDIKIIYDGIGATSKLPKNKLIKTIQMIVWN
jgi:uncharacterized protein (UPF0335 family)